MKVPSKPQLPLLKNNYLLEIFTLGAVVGDLIKTLFNQAVTLHSLLWAINL